MAKSVTSANTLQTLMQASGNREHAENGQARNPKQKKKTLSITALNVSRYISLHPPLLIPFLSICTLSDFIGIDLFGLIPKVAWVHECILVITHYATHYPAVILLKVILKNSAWELMFNRRVICKHLADLCHLLQMKLLQIHTLV